jgi:hypothetical protein
MIGSGFILMTGPFNAKTKIRNYTAQSIQQ